MNVPEFQQWIAHAKKGQKLTYYIGFLCVDREYAKNKPSMALMAEVMRASARNLVYLYQRRIGPMQFEYIAERKIR